MQKLKSNKEKNTLSKLDVNYLKDNFINKNEYHVVLKKFDKDNKFLKKKIISLASKFGKILNQNKSGEKLIEVKPNVKLIKKISRGKKLNKLRYHQTNTGGSIHSDGPQLKIPPKYVLMACFKESNKGGYSVITNMKTIYEFLKKKKPNYLKILKKEFLFERRGFNNRNDNVFSKPIFEIRKNFFRFRYLREYIEAGYIIKKKKLKKKQLGALSYLDKLIHNKIFQKKFKLNKGDIIILNNNILAHGRTGFPLNSKEHQRTIVRIWMK